ncbi:MAG: chemotaxis protein CheD [Terracidiphilus sp.]|jgi:chemotaxis protein CheD
MPELETPIKEIYVQPGESHLVSEPAVLRTVLGSCVGVTFLVPRLGVGALCHPMMPSCPPAKGVRLTTHAGRRYVDFAIREIASRLDSLGAVRGEVLVKLFGGNDVLTINSSDAQKTIGKQNYEAAIRVLAEEGFTVVASCLGGTTGVHISFETVHGEVRLRWLESGMPDKVRKAPRTAHRANRRR